MSSTNFAVISQESSIGEFENIISQLEDEIQSVFKRLRALLQSRELELLDRTDRIKQVIPAVFGKHQISLSEMKGKLAGCMKTMQLIKDFKDMDKVHCASDTLDQVCEAVRKYGQIRDTEHLTTKVGLDQGSFLCRGSLETDFADEDADSSCTENSWDLIDEKVNLDDKNVKNKCCSASCFEQTEIEDMDFAAVLCDGFDGVALSDAEELKNACKANELCSSISECVCDTPCLIVIPKRKPESCASDVGFDPVSQLSKKLCALFSNCPEKKRTACVDEAEMFNSDSTVLPTTAHQSGEDTLLKVSNAMQSILHAPVIDQVLEEMPKEKSPLSSNCVITDDVRQKFYEIANDDKLCSLNAPEHEQLSAVGKSDPRDRVAYRLIPWLDSEKSSTDECCDVVMSLNKKLGEMYQGGMSADIVADDGWQGSFQNDPILVLSRKLHRIFAA